jgi:transcriptional regulator with XRE-family HTH domain
MYEIFEQLLQKRGMSSYEVSKLSGVSQATLSDWKNGKSTPRNKTLKKIADILGVSVAYLLGEEKEKNPDTKVSGVEERIIDLFNVMSDEQKQLFLNLAEQLIQQ